MCINDGSVFDSLYNIDLSDVIEEKNGLSYAPWAAAWSAVKKLYPNTTYRIIPQIMDGYGNARFWHDDGKTGWVEVGVTINDTEYLETLPIMDLRNKSISAENITSTDANKAVKRCLVKALALHGLGLYIYLGEDLPEDVARVKSLQEEVRALAEKKSKLSEEAKKTVIGLCKEADRKANPDLEDSEITGKITNISDEEGLNELKRNILKVRKTTRKEKEEVDE